MKSNIDLNIYIYKYINIHWFDVINQDEEDYIENGKSEFYLLTSAKENKNAEKHFWMLGRIIFFTAIF